MIRLYRTFGRGILYLYSVYLCLVDFLYIRGICRSAEMHRRVFAVYDMLDHDGSSKVYVASPV